MGPVSRAALRTDGALGLLAIVAGLGLALAVQVAEPVAVPLYDGVPLVEPYRYLHPTADQRGEPGSYAASQTVTADGKSPAFGAFTTELPPQAQLNAQVGAFEVGPGAATIRVSIAPIEPPAPAPQGRRIAGNVYDIAVTDEAGAPLRITACGGCLTILIRGPENIGGATLMRHAKGAWVEVETNHSSVTGDYSTNATALGQYAVMELVEEGVGVDLRLIALVGGVAAVFIGVLVFLFLRQRGESGPGGSRGSRRGGPQPARIPSKRKRPGAPPKGRSGS